MGNPVLASLTILVMLVVGYAHWREGLFGAFCMFVNVLLAGFVAFDFFEPVADLLEPMFKGGFLAGLEDFFVLIVLFCVTLAILRSLTNQLNNYQIRYRGNVQLFGGGLFGLFTGYLLAGFFICALETLPMHENFLFFEPRAETEGGARRVLPPDRVWLSLMRFAGSHSLSWSEANPEAEEAYDRYQTFDKDATFEQRYLRYRRYSDQRNPLPYHGEFDQAIGKKR